MTRRAGAGNLEARAAGAAGAASGSEGIVSKVSEDAKPRPRARMVLRAEIVLEHGDVQTVAGHVLRVLSRGGLPGVSADDIHAIEVHPPARLILVSGEPDAVRKAADRSGAPVH